LSLGCEDEEIVMRSPLQNMRNLASKRKQKGAVAVVVGLSLVTLFAMGGVVLDLGHLYIAKSELQNTADAAALAGAQRLNETAAGVTNARDNAIAVAAQNNFNFATAVTITGANTEFGPGPDGPWSSYATAVASPAGKTFVKVDTGLRTMNTYLMRVVGPAFNTVSTLGVAVAGRFVHDITPIGVCAVDPANRTAKYTYTVGGTGITELVEFGFRRGVTYDVFGLNPLGGSSVPYLINPVSTPATGCTPASSSASFTAPFLCNGTSAVISSGVGQVYTNTGVTASAAAQLNSRFDDYTGPSQCIPAQAPPDTNIKEYPCKRPSGPAAPPCVTDTTVPPATPLALPRNWMETLGTGNLPSQQSVRLKASRKPDYQLTPSTKPVTAANAQFANYGVLWSYGPAYQADASTPPDVGAPITPGQANLNPMYSTNVPAAPAPSYFDTTNYPTALGTGFPAGTPPAPYNQTSGIYFQAPSVAHPGVRNRRILNLVLVNCNSAPVGPPSCGLLNAVGIGKFFMQTKADFSGSPKKLDLEFVGLIDPVPVSEIKLYR
jgi:Flp pilus assembly protein TadG